MKNISFNIFFENNKKIHFSSDLSGLIINGKKYQAKDDGILIYDKVKNIRSDIIQCQLSTNTSALVPALRVLGLRYNPYFDKKEVIDSQNDIIFYSRESRLAAFYNLFSTDGIKYEKREQIVRKAVKFLLRTASSGKNFLQEEYLRQLKNPCKLLGFYKGFPIFDANYGMPKLLSRIGIHIGVHDIMISTPMDKYEKEVEEIAKGIEKELGIKGIRKKNRVRFEKINSLLKLLAV